MHQDICTFYVPAMGAECGCSHSQEFDPETLHGISFYDAATRSQMRYIYPDAGHWGAGWIVRKTRGGQWETYRKANDEDIAALSGAVARAHHA